MKGPESYNLISEQPEKKKSKEKLASISEIVSELKSYNNSNTTDEIFEFEKDFNNDNEDKDFKDYLLGKIIYSRSLADLPDADEAEDLLFDTEDKQIESFIRRLYKEMQFNKEDEETMSDKQREDSEDRAGEFDESLDFKKAA